MANEDKVKILSSIEKDVSKIQNTTTQAFGPKLPSGPKDAKNDEQNTENIQTLLTAVIGGINVLLTGQLRSGKPTDVNKILSPTKDTIFGLIKDIKKAVEKNVQNNGANGDLNKDLNNISKQISKGIDESVLLQNILTNLALSNNSSSTGGSIGDIRVVLSTGDVSQLDSLVSFLTSLNDSDVVDSTAFKNLKILNDLTRNDGDLKKLTDNMSSMNLTLSTLQQSISDTTDITNMINQNLEQVISNFNDSVLAAIKSYTSSSGEISVILANLSDLNKQLESTYKDLNLSLFVKITTSIKSVFDSIQNINISNNYDNLKSIDELITGPLSTILVHLNQLSKQIDSINPDQINKSIGNIFSMLTSIFNKLSDKELSGISLTHNISLINDVVGPNQAFEEIIENISRIGKKAGSKDLTQSIRSISYLFDFLYSEKFLSPAKIIKFRVNILTAKLFIIGGLADFVDTLEKQIIVDGKKQDTIRKGLGTITQLFVDISKISEFGVIHAIKAKIGFALFSNIISTELDNLIDTIADSVKGMKKIEGLRIKMDPLFNFVDYLISLGDEKKVNTTKVFHNIEMLNEIIKNGLSDLLKSIDKLPADDQTKKFAIISTNISDEGLFGVLNILPSIKTTLTSWIKLGLLDSTANALYDTLKQIDKLPDALGKIKKPNKFWSTVKLHIQALNETSKLADANNLNAMIKYMSSISKISKAMDVIENAGARLDANPKNTGLYKIADTLVVAINRFNDANLDTNAVNALNDTVDEFLKVVVVSSIILFVGALTMKAIDVSSLIAFTLSLSLFILSITTAFDQFAKRAEGTQSAAKDFAILIVATGGIMIAAGLLFKAIDWASALGFIFTTTLFMATFAWTLGKLKKTGVFDNAMDGVKDFSMLMVVTAGVLIAGSLLFKLINWEDVIGFGISTIAFMVGMSLGIRIASKSVKEALKGAADFAILMITAGGLVIAGSLLFKAINWDNALLFIAMTIGFMAALIIPFIVFKESNLIDLSLRGAKDFAILLVAAGGIMIAGGLMMKYIDPVALALFTGTLALFMVAITLPFVLGKPVIDGAMDGAKKFAILVAVSAGILVVGGMLFTLFPDLKAGVIEFGIVLGLFMLGISTAYNIAGKALESAWKSAVLLTAVTTISATVLLIAGKTIMDNGGVEFVGNVALFAATMFGYIIIMGLGLTVLEKFKKEIIIGAKLMAGISLVTMIATITMLNVGRLAQQVSWGDFISGIGQITAGVVLLGAFMFGLGALCIYGPQAPIIAGTIAVGAGIMIGISLVAMSAVLTMKLISDNVKSFDVKKIQIFGTGVKSLVMEMVDIINSVDLKSMLKIPLVSAAILSLSVALSAIANSVKDYAELKVPVYEGTKKVGYRPLKAKDFNDAAKNVKKVITVLGQAVIDTYNKNPELFQSADPFGITKSPFTQVTKSLSSLGPMLAKISKSVKTYADLRIPKYEGTKVVGYDSMQPEHFKLAANNVATIISVLGQAVIDSYDRHPDLFETPALFGKSKFSKVVTSLSKLGPMISTIAKGVQSYANLQIATGWKVDKDGNPVAIGYRSMEDTDFDNAAMNVQTILTTLGQAIINAYEASPEMYEGTSGGLFFGPRNKFTTVIKSNLQLATLISGLGKAVSMMANLHVADEYTVDDKGKIIPKTVRPIKNEDFIQAATNVKTIITTLGKPIEEIANDEKRFELYESVAWYGSKKSKFMQVIESNIKLASLISNIGKAVSMMANLQVVTKWAVKDGQAVPETVEQIRNRDFIMAAQNITTILTTLGKPIQDIAADDKLFELYDSTGIFGGGDSKFMTVIEGNIKLADLITKIGEGVKSFADLKMPIYDDKNGQIIGYKSMGKDEFKTAADSIESVISTLGQSIIQTYESHPEYFDDGEDSDFAKATAAIGGIGNMISSIAGGISAYAQLRIPDWTAPINQDGTPTKYLQLNDDTFKKAADAINAVVTNLGKSIMDSYDAHPSWFADGTDSPIGLASAAITSMGDMISNISEGLKSYADLKIPIKYDEKGQPVDFRQMQPEDFTEASSNISLVITTIGSSIMDTYNNNKSWFTVDKDNPTNLFTRVMTSCTDMGDMIGSIAEGVQAYAEGKIPSAWDANGNPIKWTNLDKTTYENAATAIGSIITTIGGAIINTFNEHKDWFDTGTIIEEGPSWGFGFISLSKKEKPNPSDPPFVKAVKGIGQMGDMIASVAQGIQIFASSQMITYDEKGNRKIEPMPDDIYTKAGQKISKLLTSLGSSIQTTYLKNQKIFDNPNTEKILNSFIKIGKVISSLSIGVQQYANLSIPTDIDPVTGKGKDYRKVKDEDFISASNSITSILDTIGDTFAQFANGKEFNSWQASGMVSSVLKFYNGIVPVIGNLATTVQKYANLTIADKIDPNTGKPLTYRLMTDTDFTTASNAIGNILTNIGSAIVTTVKNNGEIFGDWGWFSKPDSNPKASPAYRAALAIAEISKPIASLSKVISYYAMGKFPYSITDDKGNTKIMLNDMGTSDGWNNAQNNVKRLLLSIITPLKEIIKSNEDLFKKDNDMSGQAVATKIAKMADEIGKVNDAIKNMSEMTTDDASKKLGIIQSNLKKSLDQIIELAAYLGGQQDNLTKANYHYDEEQHKNYVSIIKMNIGDYLNDNAGSIAGIGGGITNIANSVEMMVDGFSQLKDIYTKNSETILWVINTPVNSDQKSGIGFISTLLDSTVSIVDAIHKMTNKINADTFSADYQKANRIMGDVNSTFSMIGKIYDSYYKALGQYTDNYEFKNIENIIQSCKNAMNLLYDYSGENNRQNYKLGFAQYIQEIGQSVDITDMSTRLDSFNRSLQKMVEISNFSKQSGGEGYDIITRGMDGIISKISIMNKDKETQESGFEANVRLLERYVKAVNMVDLSRVIQLNKFADSLNTLSTKMGNLDKLTDALSTKVSEALTNLSAELSNTKETIDKAGKLQKDRHELIKKSTDKIKEIMNQKMIVEISQVTDTNSLSIGGSSGSVSSSSGGGYNAAGIASAGIMTASSIGGQTDTSLPSDTNLGNATVRAGSRSTTIPTQTNNYTSSSDGLTTTDITMAIINALKQTKLAN